MTTPYQDVFGEPDPQYQSAGRINYEAFAGQLGWRLNGRSLPQWTSLDPREQEAWSRGSHEVLQRCWKDSHPQPRHRRQR